MVQSCTAITTKLQSFNYTMGLVSHLAAKAVQQHGQWVRNQNSPLFLPTSFLNTLNIFRDVHTTSVKSSELTISRDAVLALPPGNAELLLLMCITAAPQAVLPRVVFFFGSEHAACPEMVAVPVSLKPALSVFLSEKNERRLGTVYIWTSPLHELTFSLGCTAGCKTESLKKVWRSQGRNVNRCQNCTSDDVIS